MQNNTTTKDNKNFKDKENVSMIVRGDIDNILEIQNPIVKKKIKKISIWYTSIIVFFIVISLFLLLFDIDTLVKHKYLFLIIEICAFFVLLVDYLLRWYTANIPLQKGKLSFFIYPIKLIPLLLLVNMVPTLYVINMFLNDHTHQIWVVLDVLKLTRIVRILMAASLFPSLKVIRHVIYRSKNWIAISFLSIGIIVLLFALAIHASEQAFFETHPDLLPKNDHGIVEGYWSAVYYCVIALTTIGFGDIQVYSSLARVLTAIMAFIGIVTIAIPSGILAGTFMSAVRDSRAEKAQHEIQHKYDLLLLKLDAVEQKEVLLTKELSFAKKDIINSKKYMKKRSQESQEKKQLVKPTKLIKSKRK